MFGKLVLSDAASFFDNFRFIERAMYSKIEIMDFMHRRNVFSHSAEHFRTASTDVIIVVLKRSAERLKTFRRCIKSLVQF